MYAEARGQQQVPSSISLYLVFGGRVSLKLELTDGAGLAAKCVVFWHVDGSASPELHFAGAHHRMWLLQGCWGSELGSLCSHANATGLKAMGSNDRALKSLNTPRENQTFSLYTDLS